MTPSLLQRELAVQLDPVTFVETYFDLHLDPWQKEVLKFRGSRLLLNCSRQSGKTTVAGLAALHRAVFKPGSLIIVVSASLRQASESYRVINDFCRQITPQLKRTEDSRLSFTLENRSRVISVPATGAKIRGFAGVDLVLFDEAARIPDDVYFSIRPMVAVSQGSMYALSTPAGKAGWFYELAIDKKNDWKKKLIPATMCPRITAKFLREEELAMGSRYYKAEYCCSFEEEASDAFLMDYVEKAIQDNIFELFPGEEDNG